jgi:hypothetical protein
VAKLSFRPRVLAANQGDETPFGVSPFSPTLFADQFHPPKAKVRIRHFEHSDTRSFSRKRPQISAIVEFSGLADVPWGGRRPGSGRRPGFRHSEVTRERIRTAMLLNRLNKFVMGEIKMSASQVAAALGLVNKTLPDLQAIEYSGEIAEPLHQVSADPPTEDEWLQAYGGQRRN